MRTVTPSPRPKSGGDRAVLLPWHPRDPLERPKSLLTSPAMTGI